MRSGIAVRVGLVLAGLLASAVIAELALRVMGAYSPASFHLLPPFSHLRDTQTGWDVMYETNSAGWRDEEYGMAKPAHTVRVATIGDSFTFGQGCPRGTIFPDVLETTLQAEDGKVEVLNLSRPGLGPEGDFVLLEEALRYRPDVVVVSFCSNDATTTEATPWLNGAVRELSHHFRLFVLGRELRRRIAEPPRLARDEGGWNELPEPPVPFQSKYGRPRTNLVAAALTDPTQVARWSDVPGEGPGWEELTRYAGRMARACRAARCRLVFGVIPDGAQVDSQQWEVRRLLGVPVSPTSLIAPGRFQTEVRELAHREGAEVFDPLADFRTVRNGLYYPLDLHWTPAGHRLYGETLARYLGRLPSSAHTPGSAPPPPPSM